MTFQKGGIKEPRGVLIEHTVTSDHPVVMTIDRAEIPVGSHLVCMFTMDGDGKVEYANSPGAKAELVAKVAAGKGGTPWVYLGWVGKQWTDIFEVALDTDDGAVDALMRGFGFAPDGGAIRINGRKWAPA